MVSGYNNFPEEMFDADGALIIGHVIPGLYDKITEKFSNNKPFFASFKLPDGTRFSGCPTVTYDNKSKKYAFILMSDIVTLGSDNTVFPLA